MPFLVDSVTMALAELGIGVHVLGHPVVPITRDKGGKLTGGRRGRTRIADASGDRPPGRRMTIAAHRGRASARCSTTCARSSPTGTRCATRCSQVAEETARRAHAGDRRRAAREAQEFLRWAADDHFTFFGYREYEVAKKGGDEVLCAVEGTGLGLLRGKEVGQAAPAEVAGRALHAAVGLGRRADPDQDQCALHACIAPATWTTSACWRSTPTASRSPSSASSACTPRAPTTAAPGTSRWCASATNT